MALKGKSGKPLTPYFPEVTAALSAFREKGFHAKGKTPRPKPVELEMAIRWRLKDGKIIEHKAFFDTVYLLTHQRAI